ncbi:MAG: ThiS family protein [Chloroflexi bacterium ADurb.Bin180]|nr:MAG: ThiS family protein [Chloroflexi bacterium ADurb.Bin180]HNR96629.1 MoaD/ThiS family protein [Anaerolineae bacterium]HNT05099.1 MoaD/ThiS family protein [Anaerolineae bacterium]HOU24196.1 MoaD/ThiS family protein [Anaerolineae bacterium]HQJ51907.1 MoaD/ThiS family protein [Anaerolineae bacterium]
MLVSVRLHAGLVDHVRGAKAGETLQVRVPPGSKVSDLARALGVPEQEIRTTFVNGRARGPDWPLEPGDEVGFFPAVGGG